MIWQISILRAGMRKSARQTAYQTRACINSPLEIKVSAVTLLRLASWCRQRSECSNFSVKTEQGGSECQIACPPAPNECSRDIDLCIAGDGVMHGDSATGAALDADTVHSAAGNTETADANAGSTAGNSPKKGGLR